jgi:nucleoside-diphosphate-sugar epimerase
LDNPAANGELFNVAMDFPVDYASVAAQLSASHGLPVVEISTPYHSNWLDNTKARMLLGWRPAVDLKLLIQRAWAYARAPDDPRLVWYPG